MLKKTALFFFILAFSIFSLFFISSLLPSSGRSSSKKYDYTFVFVGDSMTEYLGNFDFLQPDLKEYYPDKSFLLLNYGYSSTNILSVPQRIVNDTFHSNRIFEAINKIPFTIIFIESMGHNPLSQYPLNQGLKIQTQTLDKIVSLLRSKHPHAQIVFIATIAPSKTLYGKGAIALTPAQRQQWVYERNAYIQNHIAYAKAHNIPLINIYSESLDKNGDVNSDLLNPADHIHPSPNGVRFISQEIAKFIYVHTLI